MMTIEDDKEEIDSNVELRVYNGATVRTVLALRNLFFRTPLQAGVRTALPPACPFSPLRPCLAALAPPPEASWRSRHAKSRGSWKSHTLQVACVERVVRETHVMDPSRNTTSHTNPCEITA
jgi:hypothetical protein